jgi:hypothetical protein
MRVSSRFSDVRLAGVALLSKRAQGGTGKRIEGVKRGVLGLKSRARRCCFGALAALVLSACAGIGDTFDVGPFLKEQITGDTWRACLAREYQARARAHVRANRDWGEATRLAAKGRDALKGIEIAPAAGMPALGARTCACATAQARFDALGPGKAFDDARAACETSARPNERAE